MAVAASRHFGPRPGVPRPVRPAGRASAPPPRWHRLDVSLVAAVVALAGLGVVVVHSATRSAPGGSLAGRQGAYVLAGVALMAAVAAADRRWFRDFAPLAYLATVAALVGVLVVGRDVKGAQAWFQLGSFQLQPSEFAKIGLVVVLSAYASASRRLDARRLAAVVALAAWPMGLIYLQPDLGTALVFVAILLGVLLVAGARPRHLAVLALLGALGVGAVFQLGVLQQYQLDRLGAFLEPTADAQGSTWNLSQSKIAIGSGGLTGKGLFQGTQTKLAYVPEQHTDFVFTVVGEELGLAGAGAVLGLFALVVWRTWRAAALARDPAGTLRCVGVLSMLVFQVFENVGMTMGIMPITGIPLPLVSYGGSATIATFAALGLVLNVHMRRFT